MKAMVLKEVLPIEKKPLKMMDIPIPKLRKKQLLVKISICGVCHTELDEIEGRLPIRLPRVLGHEIVGSVESLGSEVTKFKEGERVGITWLNRTCGKCRFCIAGQENLCEDAQWTGRDVNGGYAQYTVISEDFTFPIPKNYDDAEAAPLLCAGIIGYRALRLTELINGQILGLYGFGASAHLVIQIVRYKYPDSKIFVFTRSQAHRDLANKLGAHWTGQAEDNPPEKVNRAIDFTPVGQTVREALRVLEKGGRLVINAIRKVNLIPELDYTKHLWYEKGIQSVTNVTKMDAEQFLPLAAEIPIVPDIHEFKLEEANKALLLLKQGKIQGAGILRVPA